MQACPWMYAVLFLHWLETGCARSQTSKADSQGGKVDGEFEHSRDIYMYRLHMEEDWLCMPAHCTDSRT